MKVSRLLIAAAWALLFSPARTPADDAPTLSAVKGPDGAFIAKPYLQIGRTPAPGTLQLLWHAPDADA
jgi:hypothetical protein